MSIKKSLYFLSLFFLLVSYQMTSSNTIKVTDNQELKEALKNTKAGDEIVLANGIWKDVLIKFTGRGTKENPIILRAETAGKVFIEGESFVHLSGEYLIVKDLYFKNGYSTNKTIISFRTSSKEFANNCKVTNCVIEEFTQPDRSKKDHWVQFWGRNNELSHCYLVGKSNQGPTVIVNLKGNEHINNNHKIINNHFGPRPRTGGPHGETLQIGSSSTSMTPAYVNVASNYFERCNGEVEIISSKSNYNKFVNNIFFECEGSLVLRHGNYATIDGNIFIGNDSSEFIGGIRVINTGHWITNNYFYKLKGNEFRSPLAVMNGVPKSPMNRYNQVTDVVVAYNSYIDCITPFHFSVGANMDKKEVLPASEIRSARPKRVLIANNLIYNHKQNDQPIKAYDKVDGVAFKNNIMDNPNNGVIKDGGLLTKEFEIKKINDWLFVPAQNYKKIYMGFDFETIENDLFGNVRTKNNGIGAVTLPVNQDKTILNKKVYGPHWFSGEKQEYTPKTISVATTKELEVGLEKANSGDILVLTSKKYRIDTSLNIDKKITIKAKSKNKKVTLLYSGKINTAAFQMSPKGNLILEDVVLVGNKELQAFGTLEKNMSIAYNLKIKNSHISDFESVLKVSKGSFADSISIANTVIKNCMNGIQLAEETDDKGSYNAEFVSITNSEFENVQQNVLDYYRGGYDESTIGGNLTIQNSKFTNCGENESSNILLKTRGIVNLDFSKNTFKNNPIKFVAVLWGEKDQQSIENTFINSGEVRIEQNLKQKLMY